MKKFIFCLVMGLILSILLLLFALVESTTFSLLNFSLSVFLRDWTRMEAIGLGLIYGIFLGFFLTNSIEKDKDLKEIFFNGSFFYEGLVIGAFVAFIVGLFFDWEKAIFGICLGVAYFVSENVFMCIKKYKNKNKIV